jgi:methyltransferase family protein
MELMRPSDTSTVIDVGVADTAFGEFGGHAATHNFLEAMYPWPQRITAVAPSDLEIFRKAFPAVTAVTADGRSLPFEDGCFDVGFSNAVVEHLATEEDQRQFVSELCRVARKVFLTTPNRWFPLEVHTLVPLAHWLPAPVRHPLFSVLGKSEERDLRLLGPRELRAVFPCSARIVNLGMTLVAVVGSASSPTPYTEPRT